ncbi:MAG TPA: recombinase family protein, partial [Armatimonadota bacterium]
MRSYSLSSRPKVACYARVSTREQLNGYSIEGQIDECMKFCDNKFGVGKYDFIVFSDEGVSGRKGVRKEGSKKDSYRPGLTDLVESIQRGEVDCIVVSQLNRIARSSHIWHELVERYIGPDKVEFFSTKEDTDAKSPGGKLLATMLMGVAQYQAEEGAERVTLALTQRKKDGYPLGYRPYGWTATPADPVTHQRPGSKVVPEQAEWVRWMVSKYLEGWNLKRIADGLMAQGVRAPMGGDLWHVHVVDTIIFNGFHYGLVEYDGELIKGAHFDERLFDPSVLENLKQVKASRRKFLTNTAGCSEALLAGFIRCSCCGERLYVVHPRGEYRGYRCRAQRAGAPKCERTPYVRGEFVERRVIEEIGKIALSPEVQKLAFNEGRRLLEESISGSHGESDDLQKQMDEIGRKQNKLMDLYLEDKIDKTALEAKSEELSSERQRYESKI